MTTGTVTEIALEYTLVNIQRQEMCGDCHACDMVHQPKKCTLKCINTCGAELGDTVEISLDNETFLKATYIMYGMPLIGLIVGLAIGYVGSIGLKSTSYKELVMFLSSFIGMAITFLIIRKRDQKRKYQKMLPQIVSIQEKK